MASKDLLLLETMSGGDMAVINGDISLGDALLMQIYLCLFGGNVEADTLGNEPAGMERLDYWGNSPIFGTTPAKRFNSTTERALRNNTLNSIGRANIQRAVESDLQYFKNVADIVVTLQVISINRLAIIVNIKQPGNPDTLVRLLWDSAKGELILNFGIDYILPAFVSKTPIYYGVKPRKAVLSINEIRRSSWIAATGEELSFIIPYDPAVEPGYVWVATIGTSPVITVFEDQVNANNIGTIGLYPDDTFNARVSVGPLNFYQSAFKSQFNPLEFRTA